MNKQLGLFVSISLFVISGCASNVSNLENTKVPDFDTGVQKAVYSDLDDRTVVFDYNSIKGKYQIHDDSGLLAIGSFNCEEVSFSIDALDGNGPIEYNENYPLLESICSEN